MSRARTSWLLLLPLLVCAVLLSPAASGAPTTNPKLFAQVGKPSPDNEAFFITFSTTEGGPQLSTIPAGTYDIQIDDYATEHNFDLKGPGGTLIFSTDVGTETHTTVTKTLAAGSYNYQCDVHFTTMKGTFTVTQATSGWTAPFDVSAADTVNAFDPGVGADATGNARFAWQKSGSFAVQTRSRTSGGTLGAVSTWDTGGGLAHPQVAVEAGGNAGWAWLFNNGSHTVVHTRAFANNVLGAKQTVSDTSLNAVAPQVSVDAAGNAYFVWQRAGGGVELRIRNANGTLQPIQHLALPATGALAPQVAAGAAGKAAFVWLQKSGSFTIVATRVLSGGTLSSVQTLSSTSQNAVAPQVGMDGAGSALYAWSLTTGTVQGRRRTSTGNIGSAPFNLGPTTGAGGQAQVAVDRTSGKAAFTWRHVFTSSGKLLAQGVTLSGSTFGITKTLSADGADATEPQVGIDGSGNVVFAWQRGSSSIQARTLKSGNLGSVSDVGSTGGAAGHPALAVAGNGKAFLTWVKKVASTDFRIEAAATS